MTPARFDPLRQLAALERHRVNYVIAGDLAGIIHGTDLTTHQLQIVPALRPANLTRLDAALGELHALDNAGQRLDTTALASGRVTASTLAGELLIEPTPTGTRGYDDLRRGATHEPLGHGLRPRVASTTDLVRVLNAQGDERDVETQLRLARLIELEQNLEITLEP